ncbi:MAG TPA: type II toxin-antitoxin system VapC family toxin, partial [bacterium]|nr:type II toxin-antitoxin system VapC family toxin [bacterium]
MRAFVLDNSIIASWFIRSQSDSYATAVLGALKRDRAHVPEIWRYELANVLLTAENRRMKTRDESEEFLKLLKHLSIEVVAPDCREWIDLLLWIGATHKLSAYDTAYLHLAMTRGWPLAT